MSSGCRQACAWTQLTGSLHSTLPKVAAPVTGTIACEQMHLLQAACQEPGMPMVLPVMVLVNAAVCCSILWPGNLKRCW